MRLWHSSEVWTVHRRRSWCAAGALLVRCWCAYWLRSWVRSWCVLVRSWLRSWCALGALLVRCWLHCWCAPGCAPGCAAGCAAGSLPVALLVRSCCTSVLCKRVPAAAAATASVGVLFARVGCYANCAGNQPLLEWSPDIVAMQPLLMWSTDGVAMQPLFMWSAAACHLGPTGEC